MYNFEKIIDRTKTNAMKLEGYKSYIFGADDSLELPFKNDEFIHMWVADMEFAVAPEILSAINQRLGREILGYTANYDDSLYKALRRWCKDRYNWDIKQEELVTSDGVIPALERLISYVVKPEEKVVFNTPGYGQFAMCAERAEREYLTTDLIYNGDGTYDFDFEDLDKKLARDDVSMFILCNPHNPTGRVWTIDEMEKIAKLVKKHQVFLISDEIHCDIRRKSAPKHIPMAKVMGDYAKMATCMAASKTFNIAGLQQSAIFIRDEEIREEWKSKYMGFLNPLSLEATIAAYNQGEKWLEEMSDYLDKNFKFMENFFKENLKDAIVTKSQTTYLGWVDLSKYFEKDEDVELFFAKVGGILLEADKSFVGHANRMIRLNLACPRSYLKKGLDRIADALLNKHDEKFTDKR